LDLSIAGRRIELRCGDASPPASWVEAFSDYFSREGESGGRKRIGLDVVPRRGWPDDFEDCGVFVTAASDGEISKVAVEIPDSSGVFEQYDSGYRGRFAIDSEGVFGLSATLQIALALLVEEAGGLLLHASGVVRDGAVWLFCGPSGAGKTTIATELKERGRFFSADRVVVELDGAGRLVASSTPFGDKPNERGAPMSGPVAGIAFIVKANEPRASSVAAFDAVSELFKQSRWYTASTAPVQRTLDNIARIMQSDSCVRLEFSRDTRLWEHLDAWRAERRRNGARV
jgi:hypothetical protein